MAARKRKLPKTVPVPTKTLLRDWEVKLAMKKAFLALDKQATRAFPQLKVPLKRLRKQVRILIRVGLFRKQLRRLGI